MDEAKRKLGDSIQYSASNYDALEDADALAIVTDWHEYRHPDFTRMKNVKRNFLIIDGHNLLQRLEPEGARLFVRLNRTRRA